MTKALTTNQFITKAIRIDGNKYNYSKTYYINHQTEVTIICGEHRRFYQLPRVHFMGYGCPRCGIDISCKDLRKTNSKFIQDAFQIHGGLYGYSKVEYINNYTKVKIVCPKHGDFMLTPHNQVSSKNGCPKCVTKHSSKISIQFLNDLAKEWKVEIQHAENKGEYKIEDPDFKCYYKSDGYFERENKKYIVEFHGDFFQANPKIYKPDGICKLRRMRFEEIYNKRDLEKIGQNLDKFLQIWTKLRI